MSVLPDRRDADEIRPAAVAFVRRDQSPAGSIASWINRRQQEVIEYGIGFDLSPKNSTHQAMQLRFSLAEMLVSVC